MSSRDSNIRAWTRHEDADWRHVINPGEAVNQVLSWRWKPTGWCRGEGWSVGTGSSLTLLLDLGMEQETWGSVSQPSIPKSSVNFLTLRRSSVLTVGRVVDRERSMSDCKVGTRTHTHSSLLLFHYCYTAYLNSVYHCVVLSIQQKLSLCRKTVQHILYFFSAHSLIISASPVQLCLQTAQWAVLMILLVNSNITH